MLLIMANSFEQLVVQFVIVEATGRDNVELVP